MNSLIGLEYKWGGQLSIDGKVDCFSLFQEARKTLGLYDYREDFSWVYEESEEGVVPVRKVLRQMQAIAVINDEPKNGDFALLCASNNKMGIGTFYNNGVITICHGNRSFWAPMGDVVQYWCPAS